MKKFIKNRLKTKNSGEKLKNPKNENNGDKIFSNVASEKALNFFDNFVYIVGIIVCVSMLIVLLTIILYLLEDKIRFFSHLGLFTQPSNNTFIASIYQYFISEQKLEIYIVAWQAISTLLLIMISIRDLKSLEISSSPLWILTINIVLINLLMYIIYRISGYTDWEFIGIVFMPSNNLLFSLLFGSISTAIVIISKEKALGFGDILAFIIMGGLLGSTKIILGFNLMIITGLTYALIYSFSTKRVAGTKVPLIFCIAIASILTLVTDIVY